MRSSAILAVYLATMALASPILKKRDDYVVVWDTVVDVVTVTAGQEPPPEATPPPAPAAPAPVPATTTPAAKPAEFYAAPSPSAPAPAPAGGASAAGPPSQSYQDLVVWHHNVHRANHSSPDLVWDAALAATAEKIASSCNYAHDIKQDGGGYGQNIAAGAPPEKIGNIITDMMYNGEFGPYEAYFGSNPSMDNFEAWGHITQILWAGTTSVGCATQQCGTLQGVSGNTPPYFTVCNYKTPGNYGGQYAANVKAPLGHPMVSA